jgi:hypothetical protein
MMLKRVLNPINFVELNVKKILKILGHDIEHPSIYWTSCIDSLAKGGWKVILIYHHHPNDQDFQLPFNKTQDALAYPSLIDEVCLKWASMKCIWCFLERHEWVAMDWDVLRLGCGLGLGVIIIAWNWGGYKQQSVTCDQAALFVAQDSNISTWPFCLRSFTLYLSPFIYVQNLFTIVLGIWFTICFWSLSPMLECLVICNFLVWFTYKGTTV